MSIRITDEGLGQETPNLIRKIFFRVSQGDSFAELEVRPDDGAIPFEYEKSNCPVTWDYLYTQYVVHLDTFIGSYSRYTKHFLYAWPSFFQLSENVYTSGMQRTEGMITQKNYRSLSGRYLLLF